MTGSSTAVRSTWWGLELAGHWAFNLGAGLALKTRAAYTFTSGEFESDFVSENPQYGRVEAGDRLPYVPEHQASLGVGLDHEVFGVNIAGTYVAPMREVAGQDDDDLMTDAQTMVDATAAGTSRRDGAPTPKGKTCSRTQASRRTGRLGPGRFARACSASGRSTPGTKP
ncbi:MAG: TonB-dependent receptor [bacterium]